MGKLARSKYINKVIFPLCHLQIFLFITSTNFNPIPFSSPFSSLSGEKSRARLRYFGPNQPSDSPQ